MFKTNDDIFCPGKAWTFIVTRILTKIPVVNQNTKVCAYVKQGQQVSYIDSVYARAKLQWII